MTKNKKVTDGLYGLFGRFPTKKNQVMHILEQWAEKTSNQENEKTFQEFINRISPKVKLPQGNKLFL